MAEISSAELAEHRPEVLPLYDPEICALEAAKLFNDESLTENQEFRKKVFWENEFPDEHIDKEVEQNAKLHLINTELIRLQKLKTAAVTEGPCKVHSIGDHIQALESARGKFSPSSN